MVLITLVVLDKRLLNGLLLVVVGFAQIRLYRQQAQVMNSIHHSHVRTHAHTHNCFMALLDFVQDYLAEPAPEM